MTALQAETRPAPPPLRRNRRFTLFWIGEGVSLLGNATTTLLLPLAAITELGAGPGWMGALTAAAWLPWLVVGLPAGAWVDSWSPRSVMITADVVAAVALASVPVCVVLDALTLTQLVVVALVNGTSTVFFRSAYVKLVTDIVPSEHLEQANGRLLGTESAMQVAGPGIGGLVAHAVTAAGALLLDAVSFMVSAVCLWRLGPSSSTSIEPSETPTLRSRIATGVAYVTHDHYLRVLIVIGCVSNFGLTGITTLLVLFLVDHVGLSSAGVGMVMACGSVGGLLGATLASSASQRWGSGRVSTLFLVGSGVTSLLVPLGASGPRVVLTVLGLFGTGVLVVAGNVIRGAWRQRYVPAELMGRVATTSQMINFGAMPLAGLTAGWLGAHLGLQVTLAVMAVINAVACWAILLTPLRRARHLPAAPAGT
ncbi:MFS transporter [Aeromicrobium terrae]|uniref:MFS transporter n=1 Tax=Aeromicrobium terrae TaxID=2498846 RepID=UPI00164F5779|nr:MFS transporter [Aeromicrobium terrae]